jgi:acetyltransferase-like isoleucine patch superfamily enzyme
MAMIGLRNGLEDLWVRAYSRLARRSFRQCGPLTLHPSARIDHPECIVVEGANIGRLVWLYAMVEDSAGRTYHPDLRIGAGTVIGDFCQITCAEHVHVGARVLFTRGVLVTDSIHVYDDPRLPVLEQGLRTRPTSIGEGCWLGNHSAVVGCSVGRHCVVGANAVVTRDVPDYCCVAGAPARVVRRLNEQTGVWDRVECREEAG